MGMVDRLRSVPSRLWRLLLCAVCLILPERLLDNDSPWHRKYDHWPRP